MNSQWNYTQSEKSALRGNVGASPQSFFSLFLSSLYSLCSPWQAVRLGRTKKRSNERFAVIKAGKVSIRRQACHTCFDFYTPRHLANVLIQRLWAGGESDWSKHTSMEGKRDPTHDDLCFHKVTVMHTSVSLFGFLPWIPHTSVHLSFSLLSRHF